MSELRAKLWALKMLILWRIRLGYWAWDAFGLAWKYGARKR